ncbi:MAG: hypothetical protein OQK52_07050, partial [Ignavibacteriaceae bacterium]|nr:hypothetical protein [Ignavibacteriaceae bacterium]
MNRTVKRIVVILIILILLPAAFLTINEMVSLNQNEEVIGRIYANQLDAILYSVNQYSEDIMNSWASRIDLFLDEIPKLKAKEVPATVDSFYDQLPSLFMVFVADSVNDDKIDLLGWNDENNFISVDYKHFSTEIHNLLEKNQNLVKRLFTYKKSGYRKLEPVETDTSEGEAILLFIEETPQGENRITGL